MQTSHYFDILAYIYIRKADSTRDLLLGIRRSKFHHREITDLGFSKTFILPRNNRFQESYRE